MWVMVPIDPPTSDVSARCISVLSTAAEPGAHQTIQRGIDFLLKEQEGDGSWYGRWGTNYIYGTWSALSALNAAGLDHQHPAFRRAVDWLVSRQRTDGGWGEDCRSYYPGMPRGEAVESNPSQTGWALLALMAAGEVQHEAVQRGISYLLEHRNAEGLWDDNLYNAIGFPRVFYLKYHGYPAFFPLWAMARYRNLLKKNDPRISYAL